MDRREDALREAIDDNAKETDRWQTYKSDNESAIRNLDMFAKSLSVEVMVPIGRKALMPGQLIHTNELMVSHSEGYFSACSAHKAKEICQHRLRLAEERLKKLETEANLWQNKLDAPLAEGAMAEPGKFEIIEDYNEEAEINWRAKHKESMRRMKQVERQEREAELRNGEDKLNKLEVLEIMEELGLDPENADPEMIEELLREIQEKPAESKGKATKDKPIHLKLTEEEEALIHSTDQQVVHQLMSGELRQTSSKKRIGRASNISVKSDKSVNQGKANGQEAKQTLDDAKEEKGQTTSENLSLLPSLEFKDEIESVEDEPVDQEDQEVQTIRNQMSLLPSKEREPFLRSQLQVLKAKMRKIQRVKFISEELTHLMNVVVILEDDLQELMFENDLLEASDEEQASMDEEAPEIAPKADPKKRRISFALSEEKLEFHTHESVAEMVPKAKQRARDIITLDDPPNNTMIPVHPEKVRNKNSEILQKVQQNLDYVQENQSAQDFDLLNRILEESTGRINTLNLSFTHSDAVPAAMPECDEGTPGTPADFYMQYVKAKAKAPHTFPIYVNGFDGEQELKVPILNETARVEAYEDPRTQFSKPDTSATATADAPLSKSILRNKSAVERESHITTKQTKKAKKGKGNRPKKERTLEDDLRDMSAYQKVMHDLVETKDPTAPDPLPKENFIDAHTPKKRVSRFKEQRSSLNKT
ncbi:LOW QUALITY PROTEIN: unconventional prefoldin RPB5 interactor-like protein [Drosophila obscura]|uniref:LOW QUALITY PROTEIN: unconventional prefoldin RPB5 interactor-like protein n=1 Tax=Drosophila obscura TaxID=7282 RepID=UPI001BB25511|nr:LOW QUALITY PROTEIN: unconventional prefoldin RPB5 interactor-like protein [Drosophila obscura]